MVPTPHIEAKLGDIAKTVVMPGDPLRAKYIAETYLEDARLINQVRGMLGYTGKYNGKEITVMGHGMGIPSIGLYTHELYNFYDVDNIIRIGTCGSVRESLRLKDVVFAMGACTDSNFARQYRLPGAFAPIATYEILEKAVNVAREMGIDPIVGNVFTSDSFYGEDIETLKSWQKMNVIATEMEIAGLYMTAANSKKNALAILTVADNKFTKETTSIEDRQQGFTRMMEIALKTASML